MMARQPIQHTDSDIPSGRVNPEGIQKATAIRRNPPPPEPDPAPTQSMPTSPPPPPATQSPPAPAQPAAAGHRRVLRPRQGTRTELVMDQRTTRLMDDSLYVIADKIGVIPKRTELFEALSRIYVDVILPRMEMMENARVQNTRPPNYDLEARESLVEAIRDAMEKSLRASIIK